MTRSEAKTEIRQSGRQILQNMAGTAKKRVNGQDSYICPLCGNGSGSDGDGITPNPRSRNSGLKCFKCGFSGDIIDLYQQYSGTDFNTALSLLAGEIGAAIGTHIPDEAVRESEANGKDMTQAMQERTGGSQDYTEYYKACQERINCPEALSFLSARGISLETARCAGLGYDPAWSSPTAHKNGKNPPESPRIIVPTSKAHYIARDIRQELTDRQKPYAKMNEGSPSVFNEQALYRQSTVFVTEGVFDALSVLEVGYEAVSLNSTGNVDAVIRRFEHEKPVSALILSLDNDDGGKRATDMLAENLERLGIPHITANISGQYKDPSECLQQDRDEFIRSVEASVARAIALQKDQKETQQAAGPEDEIDDFLQAIQGEKYRPYPIGIKDLDDRLGGGLIKQWLVLIGAEPGAGKTAFACQIMENYARQGQECIYINLEMSKEQLLARSICRLAYQRERAKMDALQVLRGYRHTESQRAIISRAADTYRKEISPMLSYHPDSVGTDIDAILESIEDRAAAAEKIGKPAPFVCLDYLQLVTGGEREDVAATLKRAVYGLKRYALNHDSIVICIMAQSRTANNSSKATMSAGRDSSNLEYGCDLQMQMMRSKTPGVVDFFITKSRFAAPSIEKPTPLLFKGAQSLFMLAEKPNECKDLEMRENGCRRKSSSGEKYPVPTKIV